MTQHKVSLTQWFDRRPLRERIMLVLCVFVVLVFAVNFMVLQPLSRQAKAFRQELTQITNQQTELKVRETIVAARKDKDPDRENRLRVEALEQASAQLQRKLEESIVNLVAPRDVPTLLKELLTQQPNLHLLRLENLPPERLALGPEQETGGAGPRLYRHPLRMEFSGDYLTLLKYLHQLENLPRALVWDEVAIETQEYPAATVRIQVHTLSLMEGWIGG